MKNTEPTPPPASKSAAISQIRALARECSAPDWDGYGAEPLSEIAAVLAVEFVNALPDNVPLPEFCGDPDGSISLDWGIERGHVLSLGIGPYHRLPYAWLNGLAKGHGVAEFDGETVPPEILDFIKMATEDSS